MIEYECALALCSVGRRAALAPVETSVTAHHMFTRRDETALRCTRSLRDLRYEFCTIYTRFFILLLAVICERMSQDLGRGVTQLAPCYIARSKVCINASGQSVGNGVFTGSDLKGGESIKSLKRPLLASLESERLKDTCANCNLWTEGSTTGSRLYVKKGTTVQTCAGCKRFQYCSKASPYIPSFIGIY